MAALAASYAPSLVGAATPVVSALDDQWVKAFEEFVEDAAYQEYSQLRTDLGYRTRAGTGIERSWTLARRLLKRAATGGMLKFTVKTVAVSSGLPADPSALLSDYFERHRYLPPIVRTSSQLSHARAAWLQANQSYTGTLQANFEHFDWFPSARVPALAMAVGHVDRDWFTKLYTTDPPLDLTQPAWQRAFERYFAVNLERPYFCSEHGVEIGYDEIAVSWGGDAIEVAMTCCCETSAYDAFALMSAFQPEKSGEYAAAMNDEMRA